MPDSRPMPSIAPCCHELRVRDAAKRITWRIMYRVDSDAVVILDIFAKKTPRTPIEVIHRCQERLGRYDQDRKEI